MSHPVTHLVYNPIAGRGRARRSLARVRRHFEAQGRPLQVHATEARGHATRIAAALPDGATVLVLGGDGTVHEVARAVVGSARTLGVLPSGSGDDFGHALGLERGDLDAALRVVDRGRVRRVDTATANGVRFVNAAGVGFDADVAARVRSAPAPLRDRSAYLYAVVATLARLRDVAVEVVVDGRVAFRGPSLLVSTQNGPRTGGSFLFAPDARIDDGLLDVLVAGDFGRLGTLRILPRVMRGTHLGHPKVLHLRGREVELRWAEPRPAHLEGEPQPACRRWRMRLEPRSLRVFG